jgi:hypothetical protein
MKKMKWKLTTFLFVAFGISANLQGQSFICGFDQLTISPVICEAKNDNGLITGSNCYLVFTISVTESEGHNIGTGKVFQLPQ